ncbi:uncharacterized protein TNIN_490481 [Trichonephila inaurata madagascariensis]|uniref:Uncharacterized protein n=1 Tax=Trichonephila inaurata madagascariensis TaxID=2747483 RepID=A0A8X6XG13_9ARAC|nr:uncharacterized protein TNIN_490481 [Trichonephila inaurata madagascariensis]
MPRPKSMATSIQSKSLPINIVPRVPISEAHHYPHTDCICDRQSGGGTRCENCNSIPTVFCYTCCQCGCRPSMPSDVNLDLPAFHKDGQTQYCSQCNFSSDKNMYRCKKCKCTKCPTDRDAFCKCKCEARESKCTSLFIPTHFIPIML